MLLLLLVVILGVLGCTPFEGIIIVVRMLLLLLLLLRHGRTILATGVTNAKGIRKWIKLLVATPV